jgi:hypothetical protein
MTVGEIERRMSYYHAIPDSWAETGLTVSAILAPYSEKGKAPRASDFIPVEEAPQHEVQARDVILDLKKQLGFD